MAGSCDGSHMQSHPGSSACDGAAAMQMAAARGAAAIGVFLSVMRQSHFLEQALCVVDLVHRPTHVARVDVDRAGQFGVEDPAGAQALVVAVEQQPRSEEHTSELQSLMRISYAVFCLKKKKEQRQHCNREAK